MIVRKFEGYGPGWNKCDCGLPLKRTKADNLVHVGRDGEYNVKVHDIIMAMKAEVAAKGGTEEEFFGDSIAKLSDYQEEEER